MKGFYLIAFLFLSCSSSKKLVDKQALFLERSDKTYTKEIITEPTTSSLEVPLDASNTPKRYLLESGKTKVNAEIQGKILKLTTNTDKRVCKDNIVEKIITRDNVIYKDKLVKVLYIPKWIYILIALNVLFLGWSVKRLLPF